MADTKISAMTAATEVFNGDVLPVVAGGANFKATRDLLLKGGTAEDITVQGVVGQEAVLRGDGGLGRVATDDAGNTHVEFTNSFDVTLLGVGTLIAIDNVGNVNIVQPAGAFNMNLGRLAGAHIQINDAGGQITFTAAGGCVVPFIDNGAGNWAVGPPADYQTAIYRLAAQVQVLSAGVPIP